MSGGDSRRAWTRVSTLMIGHSLSAHACGAPYPRPPGDKSARMSDIVVFGAGGMGREAAAWAADQDAGTQVLGFLDDDRGRHGDEVAGLSVLGDDTWLHDHPDVEILLAIGAPRARLQVARRLDEAGRRMHTVVHPTATIGPRTSIATGAIICPQVFLSCDVTVSSFAIVNFGAAIGHDGRIGTGAFVGPGAQVAGAVSVGAGAEIGIGAAIRQGVTIGDQALVGAGAVVVQDVPDGVTVVGVPARPIGTTPGDPGA